MSRFSDLYKNILREKLKEDLALENDMQIPKIKKIVVNMGVGEGARDSKKVEEASRELEKITGQKSVTTLARQSIAGFKLRDGMKVGAKVTLRKEVMYEFLDRLITIALPRVRDFRGVASKSFDGNGNYALGIKEQTIFPEIDFGAISETRGMDISIVTTATTNKAGKALLRAFGMPFAQ